MAVETATTINELDATKPGVDDLKSEGDDHVRLLKSTIKATFPNVTGVVSVTHTEINSVTSKAPLASPALTGTPTAPTATAGANTTQLSTTAFVQAAIGAAAALSLPVVDGNAGKLLTNDGVSASWDDAFTGLTITDSTASGLTLNSGYTEAVGAITGTTPALSPVDGSIQTWTLTANSTPTIGTWAAGQSITLMIDDGAGFTITWPTVSWKTTGGTAPSLNTTGLTAVAFWKVGSVIYGARVGDA